MELDENTRKCQLYSRIKETGKNDSRMTHMMENFKVKTYMSLNS
jgi:hypothetical protein